MAPSSDKNENYLKSAIHSEKTLKTASKSTHKQRHKTCSNYTPSNEQHAGLGAWQKKNRNTNTIFSHLQPACVVRYPQTLHGGRARRAHPKRCQPFFDTIPSFPLGGKMLIFGRWVNLNTSWRRFAVSAGKQFILPWHDIAYLCWNTIKYKAAIKQLTLWHRTMGDRMVSKVVEYEDYLLLTVITLRAKHSGIVYCYRTCLWRKDGRCLWRAGGVCYHDNSKLRASIFIKLGL